MTTLQKIEKLIDAISIEDFNLNFEGMGADENMEQLKHDPFNSCFIHWLDGFKAGYEKSLIISNNINDSSYSLTSDQSEYNIVYSDEILDAYLKENPQYTEENVYDNGDYDYYESECFVATNADVAFIYFTIYETKDGNIIAQLSFNYSFLDGHARYNDETLAKVVYSNQDLDTLTPEKIISDIDALLL